VSNTGLAKGMVEHFVYLAMNPRIPVQWLIQNATRLVPAAALRLAEACTIAEVIPHDCC
jgi:hypothetical protein